MVLIIEKKKVKSVSLFLFLSIFARREGVLKGPGDGGDRKALHRLIIFLKIFFYRKKKTK